MKKGIGFLLLVAASAVIVVIAFQQKESSPPKTLWDVTEARPLLETSDWQTCNNDKGGYTFKFPKDWYIYGDGATNQYRMLVGTTTCEGTNLSVSNVPPTGTGPSTSEGLDILASALNQQINLGYMQVRLAEITKGSSKTTPELILEAWADSTTPQWVSLQGMKAVIYDYQDNTPILAGIRGDTFYQIDPYGGLNPATFETILSTLKFLK